MANRYSYIPIKKTSTGTRMYNLVKYPEIPLTLDDLYILCNATDRYDKLAQSYYGDPTLWWIIATANDGVAGDSLFPPTGSYVRIPANYVDTLGKFINLNKTSIDTIDSNTNNISPGNSSGY